VKRKEEVYDIVWALADDLIKKYNPCRMKKGVCIKRRINGCCSTYDYKSKKHGETICKYLDEDKGCTIQALGCKLYLCSDMLALPKPPSGAWSWSIEQLHVYMAALRRVALDAGINVSCWIPKAEAIQYRRNRRGVAHDTSTE